MKKYLFVIPLAIACICSCGDKQKTNYVFPDTENDKDSITGFFAGEIRPEASISCFAGAYYRKIVSSRDQWVGISGKVVLPMIDFDNDRKNPGNQLKYLDNPSIYMGGRANGQETDIGMTWEVIRDKNGNVTQDARAFRPFLRRTGYAGTGQASNYANAPAEERYYWYPGDEITISLKVIRDKIILFTVAGEGKKYESEYQCDGYIFGSNMEFKRVNAIDQVSNEGKPAQVTKTKVKDALWSYTKLLRKKGDEIIPVNMHSGRYTDMRCPEKKFLIITGDDALKKLGGENITIDGAGK